jgi:uncharacterized protein YbjT (DUF2867 family)
MKITITGSLGNIGQKLTQQLVQKGHEVTVVSHDQKKAANIVSFGAKAAIGSLEDLDFLSAAFKNAAAVYTMVPPGSKTEDMKATMQLYGKNYAAAIQDSGVKYVVNLSGIGAQRAEGNGPSSFFFYTEKSLNELTGVNVLHLRPAMFMTNYYGNIGMIKKMNFIGNNFGAGIPVLLTHPSDIATAAANALDSLSFAGSSFEYVVSDQKTGSEIAQILGSAIGKPDLPWVSFSDEQLIEGVIQNGFSAHMASNFVEMGHAIADGRLWEAYQKQPVVFKKTGLSEFAKEFAAVYNRSF